MTQHAVQLTVDNEGEALLLSYSVIIGLALCVGDKLGLSEACEGLAGAKAAGLFTAEDGHRLNKKVGLIADVYDSGKD